MVHRIGTRAAEITAKQTSLFAMGDQERLPATLLVLMKGYPCVGKTTVASQLAKALGFMLLCKDDLRDHGCSNDVSYQVLWAVARRQVELGVLPGVIIESPLGKESLYQSASLITDRHLVIEVICGDDEIWAQRLAARGRDIANGKEPDHKGKLLTVEAIRKYYGDAMEYAVDSSKRIVVDLAKWSIPEATQFIVRSIVTRES